MKVRAYNRAFVHRALSLWSDWAHEDHCLATANTPYPDEDELAKHEAIMQRCKEVLSRLQSGEATLEYHDGVDWRAEPWMHDDTACVIQALMWSVDAVRQDGFRRNDGRTSEDILTEYSEFASICMEITRELQCGHSQITRKEATR
jgi:hypothetical protein